MKKLLLSAALVAVSLVSFAQTQVPNGDFENWSEAVCADEQPNGYISFADAMFDDSGMCPDDAGITKSTNKYSGTNALQLTALTANGEVSGNLLGLQANFSDKPTKLVGYVKFTKGGTDTLGINVAVGDLNDEEPVGFGELTISESQSDYMKFEITLDYNSLSTSEVSTLVLFFGIGNEDDGASESTVALIDNLSFEYTAASAVNYSAKSPINVFAENNNINFSENVSDVHVVDMVGASKLQEAASTKTVNTSSLNTGLYVVTYNYNGNYFSKKVVVE